MLNSNKPRNSSAWQKESFFTSGVFRFINIQIFENKWGKMSGNFNFNLLLDLRYLNRVNDKTNLTWINCIHFKKIAKRSIKALQLLFQFNWQIIDQLLTYKATTFILRLSVSLSPKTNYIIKNSSLFPQIIC